MLVEGQLAKVDLGDLCRFILRTSLEFELKLHQVHIHLAQHPHGEIVTILHETKHEVLRPEVVVTKPQSLIFTEVKDVLYFG